MSYLTKWTIGLVINTDPEIFINPLFEGEPDFTFNDTKEEGEVYYRKSMETEFFLGDEEYLTFQGLLLTCPTLSVSFYYDSQLRFEGRLNLDSSEFFLDVKRVKLIINVVDLYTCVLDFIEENENIFDTSTLAKTVKTIAGTVVQCISSSETTPSLAITDPDLGPLPCGDPLLVTSSCPDCQDQTIIKHQVQSLPGNKWLYTETYGREELVLSCADVGNPAPATLPGGFNLLLDDCGGTGNATYTRELTTVFDSLNSTGTTGGEKDFVWNVVGLDTASTIDNGRKVADLLTYFFGKCGIKVESNALNITPSSPAPSNGFYTWADPALHNLILFQITDVKNPDAAQNASRQDISLRYILNLLRDMFQIYWQMEPGNVVVVEHISYFTGPGVNENLLLTENKFVEFKNRFTVEPEEQPKFEKFSWIAKTLDEDFDGLPIEYTCFDENDKDVEYNLELATFIEGVFYNPGQYPDTGFVMIAAIDITPGVFPQTLIITDVTQPISGQDKYNGHLTWANLHDKAWKWDRFQEDAIINGASVVTIDPKKKRLQEPVTYFKETEDYFNIDFQGTYLTAIGNGKVKEASYSSLRKALTLNLKHD